MAALGDINAAMIAFVNEALGEEFDSDGLQTALKLTLNELSRFKVLVNTDTSQTLIAGDVSLDEPTGYKSMIALTLNDGTQDLAPLQVVPGGFEQYRDWKEREINVASEPEWYSPHDDKFFIYPDADKGYTPKIEFYRKHPADDGTDILFPDDVENALMAGVTYYKALLKKKTEYIAIWLPVWLDAKEFFRMSHPPQPAISRG